MTEKKANDQFSAAESKRRVEAALRGARIAGHKPMNDIPKKGGKSRARKKAPPKRG
jgi:hypothetical protein